jgi:hypothetical protein
MRLKSRFMRVELPRWEHPEDTLLTVKGKQLHGPGMTSRNNYACNRYIPGVAQQ